MPNRLNDIKILNNAIIKIIDSHSGWLAVEGSNKLTFIYSVIEYVIINK